MTTNQQVAQMLTTDELRNAIAYAEARTVPSVGGRHEALAEAFRTELQTR